MANFLPVLTGLKLIQEEGDDNLDELEIQKKEEKKKQLQTELSRALLGLGNRKPGERPNLGKALTQLVDPNDNRLKNHPPAPGKGTESSGQEARLNAHGLPYLHLRSREGSELTTVIEPASIQTQLQSFTPDAKKMIPNWAIKDVIKEQNWRKIKLIGTSVASPQK